MFKISKRHTYYNNLPKGEFPDKSPWTSWDSQENKRKLCNQTGCAHRQNSDRAHGAWHAWNKSNHKNWYGRKGICGVIARYAHLFTRNTIPHSGAKQKQLVFALTWTVKANLAQTSQQCALTIMHHPDFSEIKRSQPLDPGKQESYRESMAETRCDWWALSLIQWDSNPGWNK